MADRKTYQYQNDTKKIQIIRIPNAIETFLERVVFPGQKLFFEAFPEDILEIRSSAIATAIILAHNPCASLDT